MCRLTGPVSQPLPADRSAAQPQHDQGRHPGDEHERANRSTAVSPWRVPAAGAFTGRTSHHPEVPMTLRRPVLTTLLLALATTAILGGARLASNADSPPPAPAAAVPAAEAVGKLTLATSPAPRTTPPPCARSRCPATSPARRAVEAADGCLHSSDGTSRASTPPARSPLLLRTAARPDGTCRRPPMVVYATGHEHAERAVDDHGRAAGRPAATPGRAAARPRAPALPVDLPPGAPWTTYAANGSDRGADLLLRRRRPGPTARARRERRSPRARSEQRHRVRPRCNVAQSDACRDTPSGEGRGQHRPRDHVRGSRRMGPRQPGHGVGLARTTSR